jgi:hypothetical protein
VPVKLWSGSDDVFSPATHTYWLAKEILTSELDVETGAAHFGAVEILPEILAWVAGIMNIEPHISRPSTRSETVPVH